MSWPLSKIPSLSTICCGDVPDGTCTWNLNVPSWVGFAVAPTAHLKLEAWLTSSRADVAVLRRTARTVAHDRVDGRGAGIGALSPDTRAVFDVPPLPARVGPSLRPAELGAPAVEVRAHAGRGEIDGEAQAVVRGARR